MMASHGSGGAKGPRRAFGLPARGERFFVPRLKRCQDSFVHIDPREHAGLHQFN